MLVLIAVELAAILLGMVGAIVAVVREGRKANRRNDRLVALIVEEIGVEGELLATAKSTAELTEQVEVATRQTRKALGG